MAQSLADFVRKALEVVEEISPEGAAQILEKPDRAGWDFVDVREPDEFAAGHIPGAQNFPRGFLEVRADLEHTKRDPWFEDRGRKMILYCGRSPECARRQDAARDGIPADPVPRRGMDGLGRARATRRALRICLPSGLAHLGVAASSFSRVRVRRTSLCEWLARQGGG